MRILGIDPGLAHFGVALLEVDEDGGRSVVDMMVFNTTKDPDAHSVAEDTSRRAQEITRAILSWIGDNDPWTTPFCKAAAERYSAPRISTGRGQTAIKGVEFLNRAWGIVDTLLAIWTAERDGFELFQPTPKEIKAGVAHKGASKAQVQAELMATFGPRNTTGILRKHGVKGGDHEHAFDALGAAVVSVPGDSGRLFR